MSDTAAPDHITAHRAVELVLSHRAATEPGFLERVAIDPRGVVESVIAEVSDDVDLDLAGVDLNVHVQSPSAAHFVIELPQDEVVGFARRGGFTFAVRPPTLGAASGGTVGNNTTTDTACHTNVCKSKAEGSCPRPEEFMTF